MKKTFYLLAILVGIIIFLLIYVNTKYSDEIDCIANKVLTDCDGRSIWFTNYPIPKNDYITSRKIINPYREQIKEQMLITKKYAFNKSKNLMINEKGAVIWDITPLYPSVTCVEKEFDKVYMSLNNTLLFWVDHFIWKGMIPDCAMKKIEISIFSIGGLTLINFSLCIYLMWGIKKSKKRKSKVR